MILLSSDTRCSIVHVCPKQLSMKKNNWTLQGWQVLKSPIIFPWLAQLMDSVPRLFLLG